MDLGLSGKRAAVMGASKGLGRATALALSREGARVAICARDAERVEAAAREISKETGNEVIAFPADASREEDVVRFVESAAGALGGLDVLVKNTGGPPHGRFKDFGDDAWQGAFDLVVMSYVRAVRAAIPHFRRAGGGAVVAIESSSVKDPIPNLLLSNALRPAVVALSKSLANDHASENIRFNVILPGSMDTDRIRDLARDRARETGQSYEDAMAARTESIPMKRLGAPGELGDAVAFLASPRASYVTGAALQVDGGILRSVW